MTANTQNFIKELVVNWQKLPQAQRANLFELFALISPTSHNLELNEQSNPADIALEIASRLTESFGQAIVESYIQNIPIAAIADLTLYDFLADFLPDDFNIGIY